MRIERATFMAHAANCLMGLRISGRPFDGTLEVKTEGHITLVAGDSNYYDVKWSGKGPLRLDANEGVTTVSLTPKCEVIAEQFSDDPGERKLCLLVYPATLVEVKKRALAAVKKLKIDDLKRLKSGDPEIQAAMDMRLKFLLDQEEAKVAKPRKVGKVAAAVAAEDKRVAEAINKARQYAGDESTALSIYHLFL